MGCEVSVVTSELLVTAADEVSGVNVSTVWIVPVACVLVPAVDVVSAVDVSTVWITAVACVLVPAEVSGVVLRIVSL